MLTIHITIVIVSLIIASWNLVTPTKTKLKISYALIAATILTGTSLVVFNHISILHACISGLLYVSIATSATSIARRKLAASV